MCPVLSDQPDGSKKIVFWPAQSIVRVHVVGDPYTEEECNSMVTLRMQLSRVRALTIQITIAMACGIDASQQSSHLGVH